VVTSTNHCVKEKEMILQSRALTAVLIGISIPCLSLASNSLPGHYEGNIKEISGYPGQPGGRCEVIIGNAADYGGSTTFSINNVDQFLVENTKVDKPLGYGKKAIKLVIPPQTQGGDIDIIFIRVGKDRLPVSLKMLRKNDYLHTQEKLITCGNLVRK